MTSLAWTRVQVSDSVRRVNLCDQQLTQGTGTAGLNFTKLYSFIICREPTCHSSHGMSQFSPAPFWHQLKRPDPRAQTQDARTGPE